MVEQLFMKLASQGWINLFYNTETPVFETEVVESYENLAIMEGDVATSKVHGVDIVFEKLKLGEILRIPSFGLAEYVLKEHAGCVLTSKFIKERVIDVRHKVYKEDLRLFLKLLFKVVHKGVFPKGECRRKATFCDIRIAHAIDL